MVRTRNTRTNRVAALVLAGAALSFQSIVAQPDPGDTVIRKRPYKPAPQVELRHRAEVLVRGLNILSLTPPLTVSPAFPFREDKAYLRATASKAVMVIDARADGLLMPAAPVGLSLEVFVHGTPGKATVIDCAIDLSQPGPLVATYRSGPDAATSQPDPQQRQQTISPNEGHYTFAVPGEVPSLSPSNWFSLRIGIPSAGSLTLYGCGISIAA